jgi:hypothetical protein
MWIPYFYGQGFKILKVLFIIIIIIIIIIQERETNHSPTSEVLYFWFASKTHNEQISPRVMWIV